MGGHRRIRKTVWLAVAVMTAGALVACTSSDDDDGGDGSGTIGGTRVTPTTLDFPETSIGLSARLDLVIDNPAGGDAVTLESVAISGTDAAMFSHTFDATAGALDPGSSTTVVVTFAPTTLGPRSATLAITQSDGRTLSVPLTGNGLPKAPSSLLVVGAPELNASTYALGSIRFTNDSPEGQQIASLEIDLSTSLLSDLIFDPEGKGGDTTSRDFTVAGDPGVGTIEHTFSGPHDLGFDVLSATFTDFVPGKTVAFSVDIDPTTIRGTEPPGPGESGSVSGLEAAGATVTVTYEDGTTQKGNLFRSPDSLGQSEVRLNGATPPAPTLAVIDGPEIPGTVGTAAQTIRVSGPAGAIVRLLAVEGALFTEGLADGGFDIDPFESNSLVAVTEHPVTIGPDGTADVPVTLTFTNPSAGSNRFLAALTTPNGTTGPTSNLITLQLTPEG